MPWATAAETVALTGVTVDSAVLAQAQGVIEVFAGVSEDDDPVLTTTGARLLKSAVAYQAAWMFGQIDVTTRVDVSELDQDGTRMRVSDPDALVLAPLAKRCLDRLPSRGARSRRVRRRRHCGTVFEDMAAVEAAFLSDGPGFAGEWEPLS